MDGTSEVGSGRAGRTWNALRRALPVGGGLSPSSWRHRHRVVCALVWLHVPVVVAVALRQGESVAHALAEGAILAVLGAAASVPVWPKTARAAVGTLGLVSSSAIVVHLSGGMIEMHFHFFVVVAVVSLYQSWVPFLIALAFVVVHHGVAGALVPESVYNHPAAVADAWKWALVHGAFILAESAACLAAWRLNEVALHNERKAREQLQRANDDLVTAQRLSSIGSWDWDVTSGTVWWSREMYTIFGRDPGDFLPSVRAFLAQVHDEDRDRLTLIAEQAATSIIGDLDVGCRIVRPDGEERVVHVLGHAAIGDDGRPTRLMGTVQDVTERRELEREIEHRAFHDSLTGLANRALFLDRLTHALQVRGRTGASVAVLYLDLDGFKSVNDMLGHAMGDALLVGVGERVRSAVRVGDTVARLGGDEFAVLLENVDAPGAVQVAELILSALDPPIQVDGAGLVARASIGIVVAEQAVDTVELLRRADVAMYAAKRRGKHTHRLYEETMRPVLSGDRAVDAQIVEGLEAGQFMLHVQPMVDLATGTVTALECLARWDHPVHGTLPPATFLPVAEQTGLVGRLGEWVLGEVIAQACLLRDALDRPLPVSVNVSPGQLSAGFVDEVARRLAAAHLEGEHLLVEIDETSIVVNETLVDHLEGLRALGVGVAVDGFGNGGAALVQLSRLPVAMLKVDRRFIRNITGGPEESALTRAVVKLADIWGLVAVAEGVETSEQAALLRSLGCHLGQGFHFGPPAPVGHFLGEVAAGRLSVLAAAPAREH